MTFCDRFLLGEIFGFKLWFDNENNSTTAAVERRVEGARAKPAEESPCSDQQFGYERI